MVIILGFYTYVIEVLIQTEFCYCCPESLRFKFTICCYYENVILE